MTSSAHYGDAYAGSYDRVYEDFAPPSAQLELLSSLVDGRRALELGVGSGRIALPLAGRGVSVLGVDSSQAMIGRLIQAATDRGLGSVVEGLHASATELVLSEHFDLVYAPFNFVYLVGARTEQRTLFATVAGLLADGAAFVTEAFVPRPGQRLPDGAHPAVMPHAGRSLGVKAVMDDMTILAASDYDETSRHWRLHEILLDDDGVRTVRSDLYCTAPEDLHALAAEAGLRVRQHLGDWDGRPFDETSPKSITVYEKEDRA